MNILVFGGTTEARLLLTGLAGLGIQATACVATGYGSSMLGQPGGNIRVMEGRLDQSGMETLLREGRYTLAVDATHPYAEQAGAHIIAACSRAGVPVLRVGRKGSPDKDYLTVNNAAGAATVAAEHPGNVLLATGSKDLAAYTGVPGFPGRIYVRLLPVAASIEHCISLGYDNSRIIAMHGPFSEEMNKAVIRQYAIKLLVTKDGGAAGGFPEKVSAAKACGVKLVVIGRPEGREGMPIEDVLLHILRLGKAGGHLDENGSEQAVKRLARKS